MRFCCFRKRDLLIWKARAFRGRVWFKTLNRLERGLLDSVIKVVDTVRSTLLMKVLMSIVKKLQMALESPVKRMMKEAGQPLAEKISLIAQSWGHKSAHNWKEDKTFIRFLAVIQVNKLWAT